jgi:hypothetical protein
MRGREGNGPIRGGQCSPAPSEEGNCATRLFPSIGDSPARIRSKVSDPRWRPIWSCEMEKKSKNGLRRSWPVSVGAVGRAGFWRSSGSAEQTRQRSTITRSCCGWSGHWKAEMEVGNMHGIWVASELIFAPSFHAMRPWDICRAAKPLISSRQGPLRLFSPRLRCCIPKNHQNLSIDRLGIICAAGSPIR